ncbi:MAG: alpha/beta hydrolase family protein [Leucobacter sp.]
MSTQEWGRALGRTLGIGAGAALLGIAGAAALGGVLARRVVTPEPEPESPVEVVALQKDSREDGGQRIIAWLRGRDARLPGRYSLIFDDGEGSARVGPVTGMRSGAVAREVLAVDRGTLLEGARGRITGWWYASPEELGFRTERITYETELGEAEAWLVHPRRARKKRWAVHVHGRGAGPLETLRGVAPLACAGITSLVISYRNDAGAPVGENGRYGIGLAESRDVDAAIAEALGRGAERVTLFGWSMGGTASLVAATRGAHRGVIDGVILDSPALDWSSLLRYHASGMLVPRAVADVGIRMLDRGLVRGGEPGGIPFETLTPDAFASELAVPVLIHASSDDTFVPCDGAKRLAALKPELVQLRLVDGAEHVKLWNVDPEPWELVTEQFARALPRPPWRG